MVASLLTEQRISFKQLAREQDVSIQTIWRWVNCGCRGIRLESFQVGGRHYTTREAFGRWMQKINGEPVTAPRGRRDVGRMERDLVAAGA